MKINLTVKDDATPALQRLAGRLDGRGMRVVHSLMGKRLEVNLREHFRQKDGQPGKRGAGWPKQHFWARIRRATAMIAATSSKAVVSVADPAMAARIHGAVIRPKDAKAIAIPLDPEYAGVRPKAVWDRDRLFVWKNKEGKPFIAKTSASGKLNVVYRLAIQVIHPKDPTALPDEATMRSGMVQDALRWILKGGQA